METLTTAQRMEIVMDSPRLPVGQMCRKLQYPVVTVADLEKRFAVKMLADHYNGREVERILVDLAKSNLVPYEEVKKRVTVNLEDSTYRDSESAENRLFDIMLMYEAFASRGMRSSERQKPKPEAKAIRGAIKAKYCKGLVKVESLDAYMGDEIPARVLESLEVAREAGLTDFHVAYPVIEVKEVEVRQEQQKDPVLLAKLGDRFLEIDMWE